MSQPDPASVVHGDPVATRSPRSGPGWWASALLVALVVLLGYGIAPTRLPLMGEETCRALHGVEMARSGDWLVATNHGVPILDRPPMQYWKLALIHRFVHPLDAATLRWSMVLTTLATALLVLWYARRFLSPAAALCAAVAYPTMGHVLDLGRRVETDGLFALLLAAALLTWHAGYDAGRSRGAPETTARGVLSSRPALWLLAALLAALATLTKGLQGPVAFFGAIVCFLGLRREWRLLFGGWQLAIVVLFLGIVAIWQVPFFLETGWEGTRSTWISPGGQRLDASPASLLTQLGIFPLEVLAAMLPWSPLLLGLLFPRFWVADARFRSAILFLLLGVAALFVPVWISAGGHQRYVMPMYPLVAVLCGAVVDRALALDLSHALRRFWRDYQRIMAVLVVAAALGFVVVTIVAGRGDDERLTVAAQPWWLLIALLATSLAGGWSLLRVAPSSAPRATALSAVVLASLVAIFYVGPYLNIRVRRSLDVGPRIEALRSELEPEHTLVAFGPLHDKFVYWYGAEIPIVQLPTSDASLPDDLHYFAVSLERGRSLDLPFAWEELEVLNMDRKESADPENRVVIGRRLR